MNRWTLPVLAAVTLAATGCSLTASGRRTTTFPPVPPPVRVLMTYSDPPPPGLKGPYEPAIVSARPDGSHPRRIAVGGEPLISPSGRWIAYIGSGARPGLRLIGSTGGRARVIASAHEPLAWSQDSTHLLASAAQGVRLVDVGTGTSELIRLRGDAGSGSFSFAPDGRSFAYQQSDNIYSYSLATGTTTQLTSGRRAGTPLWGRGGLAYQRFGKGPKAGIWVMHDGQPPGEQITAAHEGISPAAWSADGTRMLAANPSTNNGRLWAVNVTAHTARQLTPWRGDLYPQGLSRDGRTVLAAVGCGGGDSPYGEVETIPFAGGTPTLIVRGPCRASWNR